MTELETLAQRARRTLSEAREATLLVESLGHVVADNGSAVLHDRDGSPAFLCSAGCPVTAAAAQASPAVLSVPMLGGEGAVIFVGTLMVTGAVTVDGERVDVVELLLASVVVECDEPDGHVLVQREVPLSHYGRGEPLDSAAAAIRCHTNARHGRELREFVAARGEVSQENILAATVGALTAEGIDLDWVDAAGAHRERLRFAEAATTSGELAAMLRCRLAHPFAD